MPPDLHWFKWEAYLTCITGFGLLVVQYYWNASTFLIDPGVMPLTGPEAIAISVVSLAAGWFVYDGLCRSPIGENTTLLAVAVFVLIVAAAFIFTQVFSGARRVHPCRRDDRHDHGGQRVRVIIPNQKKMIAELLAGRTPDAEIRRRSASSARCTTTT